MNIPYHALFENIVKNGPDEAEEFLQRQKPTRNRQTSRKRIGKIRFNQIQIPFQ